MFAARNISVFVIFYSFNCLLHFAVEDALGLTPQNTIFGYEYGRCMSCLIVGIALFLVLMHFKRMKNELFTVRKDLERKQYTAALLSCIAVCIMYSTRLLYLYLSGKADIPILLNIFVTIFIILVGALYLCLEQKNVSNSNFKIYCSVVYFACFMFLSGGGYCMSLYSPPFVLRSINKDILMLNKVNEIASILKDKRQALNSQDEVINELGYYHKESFLSGAVKYQKEDEHKFSLFWTFKTKKEDLLKIKRLKYICRDAHVFLVDGYREGVNTQTYECRSKPDAKPVAGSKPVAKSK
jgi:hypothetical protein